MNTFTAEDMKDYGDYVATLDSAMLSPNFEKWCKERFEPAKKVIDLSVLIESGIDVELGDFQGVFFLGGHLTHIIEKGSSSMYNASDSTNAHSYARPRMNHKHAWFSGNCPLPEGFVVEVWYRDGLRLPDNLMNSGIYNKTGWIHKNIGRDIIAFEVLGKATGYVMPWEQDDE